jgi:integrase
MSQIDQQTRAAIAEINARLKTAKIGVTVRARGDRLCIRGTFPPKPGKAATKPIQADIPLGIRANSAGLKAAEKAAKKIGVQLAEEKFTWAEWLPDLNGENGQSDLGPTIGEWLKRFEINYFEQRRRSPKSETTWHDDYLSPLKKLPQDLPISPEILRQLIVSTKPDSRTRQRCCMAVNALARFTKVDFDAKPLRGNYSPRSLVPRDLPSDTGIIELRDHITNRRWQYAFGLLVTYGLRPHELCYIDLERLKNDEFLFLTEIDEDGGGKTGGRRVPPLRREWYQQWRLTDIHLMPEINGPNNKAKGRRVGVELKKYGVTHPYNFRHAWAVRTSVAGFTAETAARWMGHSVSVHERIYHAWLSEASDRQIYEAQMSRDRPPAP